MIICNNKGLTAIEILVCFSIVVVIVMSMFKVVNNQRDKQLIESYKNSITTYKNSVTKTIEEDIRKNGGIRTILDFEDIPSSNNRVQIGIHFQLTSGEQRYLRVYKEYNCDEDCEVDDCSQSQCEKNNHIQYIDEGKKESEIFRIPDIYNLRFNLIDIGLVGQEGKHTQDGKYLKIYVEFIHPDLGTRYSALNLIYPIDSDIFSDDDLIE